MTIYRTGNGRRNRPRFWKFDKGNLIHLMVKAISRLPKDSPPYLVIANKNGMYHNPKWARISQL